MIRVAVLGHVEWMDFGVVAAVPKPGEIVQARDNFQEAAGGGAVAAVQLRKLAGAATFYTAIGSDLLGAHARDELSTRHGVDVYAAVRHEPQRRGWTYLDDDHERTITTIGARLVARGGDELPWEDLEGSDGVYVTGGDAEAIRRARAARVLVATPRALDGLREAGVELDVLVASADDATERAAAEQLDPRPRHVVFTAGKEGGRWEGVEGTTGHFRAAEVPGEPVDSYGCGDSFAAGLTFGLAVGMDLPDALGVAARCGASCLTGRGPYGRQLTAEEL